MIASRPSQKRRLGGTRTCSIMTGSVDEHCTRRYVSAIQKWHWLCKAGTSPVAVWWRGLRGKERRRGAGQSCAVAALSVQHAPRSAFFEHVAIRMASPARGFLAAGDVPLLL